MSNQQTNSNNSDVIMRLLSKIENKNQQIEDLKTKVAKKQAYQQQKQEEDKEEIENQEQEEEADVFFKEMKPKTVGFKERRNAIVEWFKSKGKRHRASVPVISEKVFGYRTTNSSHSQYHAVRNAIQQEPRVISANSKDGRYTEYKLSNKVKVE